MKKCTKCGTAFPITLEYFSARKGTRDGLQQQCRCCTSKQKKQYRENNIDKIAEINRVYTAKNKEKMKAYKKAYYEANKVEILKKQKNDYEAKKEIISERQKCYYQANKEDIKTRVKQWRLENIEKVKKRKQDKKQNIALYQRQYYEANKDYYVNHTKQYRQDNSERLNLYKKLREARKRKLLNDLTAKQWEQIKAAFGDACCYCGQAKQLTIEHFIPLDRFGEMTINNVLPACSSCNSSKKNKDFFSWYPNHKHYDKHRERKILKFLNYQNGTQQITLGL
jgi:hypothetical protein